MMIQRQEMYRRRWATLYWYRAANRYFIQNVTGYVWNQYAELAGIAFKTKNEPNHELQSNHPRRPTHARS